MTQRGSWSAPAERRDVLGRDLKELLVAVLLRYKDLFDKARRLISAADVHEISEGVAVVWLAAERCLLSYGEMPGGSLLRGWVKNLAKAHPADISEPAEQEALKFVDRVFSQAWYEKHRLGSEDVQRRFAQKTLKQLHEEILAARFQERVRNDTSIVDDLAADLRALLHEAEQGAALEAGPAAPVFGEAWEDEEWEQPQSTGVPALDFFLGGGHLGGEAYIFMAPYAGGKTILACQATTAAAKQAQQLTASPDNIDGILYKAVLVSYEASAAEFKKRCISLLANIPYSRVISLGGWKNLRSGGELLEYEQQYYRRMIDAGLPVPTEKQRVAAAIELVDNHVVFLDMTDTRSGLARGSGGVLEIAAMLRAEQSYAEPRKLCFNCLWLDHIAALANNVIAADVTGRKTMRDVIGAVPAEARKWLGQQFNMPIWLLHQLSGEANSRGVTSHFHHTDAHECKSVGMLADFCIQSGPPTKDGRSLCVWECTKPRREKPPTSRQVVRLDGAMQRIRYVGDKYNVDDVLKAIVTSDDKKADAEVAPPTIILSQASADGSDDGLGVDSDDVAAVDAQQPGRSAAAAVAAAESAKPKKIGKGRV